MELAAERKPKETIALATQIIRTHMGCRHYTAAATVSSWVIPKIDSGKLEQEVEYMLPESDIRRSLITIRKAKETPNIYPRKAGTPAKDPLK